MALVPASTGPAATADWAFEFYVDESKFTRAERLGIPGETVTTMQGIHSKVMSLDSCEVKAEIKSWTARSPSQGASSWW
ncbi:hypothetical protein CLOM_g14076 [Closterium sp. NIES-68]|nr:hypothetical protein CLOM_g14076 [Closterium sp. NIES-68]